MHPEELALDYVFGETLPPTGTLFEVAPGVSWLRMVLPFALNHINLWLLEDRLETDDGVVHGWTVVDCGINDDSTRAAWEHIFTNQLRGLPIVRVIVTHCHPDHVGLAAWICERWNVQLWMTAGEYTFARMMSAGLPGVDGGTMYPHFERHGLSDPALREQLKDRKNYYPSMVPTLPHAYIRLFDQQVVDIGGHGWRVITGFGHAPEHAALSCTDLGLLISGDMILPRISTNVSVGAIEPESNPVQLFLDSLGKYADLPADTLVLPSHGRPFRGIHIRIEQLSAHHAARLAEVFAYCGEPRTALDIVPVMFPRALDGHQLSFAIGEALAHLHQLWFAHRLTRSRDADGVFRFQQVQATD